MEKYKINESWDAVGIIDNVMVLSSLYNSGKRYLK